MSTNADDIYDSKPLPCTPGKRGGLRKIADEPRPCMSREHNPPNMMTLSPGTYEYTCPACGHTVAFHVRGVYFGVNPAFGSIGTKRIGTRTCVEH